MWRSSGALSASIKVSRSLCSFIFFFALFATPRRGSGALDTTSFSIFFFPQIFLRSSPAGWILPRCSLGICIAWERLQTGLDQEVFLSRLYTPRKSLAKGDDDSIQDEESIQEKVVVPTFGMSKVRTLLCFCYHRSASNASADAGLIALGTFPATPLGLTLHRKNRDSHFMNRYFSYF